MYNPFSLDGKTILVTGASSGIGRETAIQCSKMGAEVIITGRNVERLTETFGLLDKSLYNHKMIAADISNDEGIDFILIDIPNLDGCVLNAGVSKMKPLQYYSFDMLLEIFGVNCFSPMILLKQLIKKKKMNRFSSIVFTGSISGYSNVSPANGIYGSSKSALTAYMKYAALELASKNIRCNAVHPARVDTPLIQNQPLTEEAIKKDLDLYPLSRYGKPEDVAYAIIYLLSDASVWVTGTDLLIDGGRSLR